MGAVSPVNGEDIRRLMRARLSEVAGQLTTIHTSLLDAIGVEEAVQLRLDFLHVVVYDDRMMDPSGPYHELVVYTPSGEIAWFDPFLIEVAARFPLQGNLETDLNSYFDYLDGVL